MTIEQIEAAQIACLRELERARERVKDLFRRCAELDRMLLKLHRKENR